MLNDYAVEVFVEPDLQLETLGERAEEAGLPSWAISPDVGKLLEILTSMTEGRIALELGTLGGYSAIWIARGLAPDGMLYTVEIDDAHASFAEREIAEAGLADNVEVVRGAALEVLDEMSGRLLGESIDFAFVDAAKDEYVAYFEKIAPMLAIGGLFVADNAYGTGQGWIQEGHGADELNRRVAADPDFDAVAIPMRAGVLIARKNR